MQRLQFCGIKFIYQYKINGEQITSKDEIELHNQLSLSFLDVRRKKHLLKMMYDMIVRKPELIAESKSTMSLRSDNSIRFEEERINYERYGKSPYMRGNALWKQLAYEIQHACKN